MRGRARTTARSLATAAAGAEGLLLSVAKGLLFSDPPATFRRPTVLVVSATQSTLTSDHSQQLEGKAGESTRYLQRKGVMGHVLGGRVLAALEGVAAVEDGSESAVRPELAAFLR